MRDRADMQVVTLPRLDETRDMPWTMTKDSGRTRFRLSGGWGLKGFLAAPFIVVFLGAFGPGFLGLGSMILSVSCERTAARSEADCEVVEGFLFGLIPYRHVVSGATGVGSTLREERQSSLVFQTATKAQPLLTL